MSDDSAASAPRISVIVPFHGDAEPLRRALAAFDRLDPADEVIVVADGAASVKDGRLAADAHQASVIEMADRSGPAAARNAGARAARHGLLVFVDADVVVAADALPRLVRSFAEHPTAAAIFGAYDEAPADPGFVSQYKNLAHAFVHRSSPGPARTFWAGLGAIRREAFFDAGGFDERFRRPSIEDIDLGYRLTRAGYEIRLDPSVRGRHLKRWTLTSMIASDVRDRGIPWTQLLLQYGAPRDGLNLRSEYRVGMVLTYAAASMLALSVFDRRFLVAAAVLLAGVAVSGRRYYGYFLRVRGPWFALRAFALHALHHLYNGASFAIGSVLFLAARMGIELPGALPTGPWRTPPGPKDPAYR